MIKKPSQSLDFNKLSTIYSYGYQIQDNVSKLSDRAMKVIINTDLESVSALIVDILHKLETFTIEDKKTIFDKLWPGEKTLNSVKDNYDVIDTLVKELEQILTNQKIKLHMSLASYETCIEESRRYAGELEEYLNYGNEQLKGEKNREFKGNKDFINMFEERLHSLGITQIIVCQLIGQLELVIASSISMINKINDLLKSVIPLWRSGLVVMHGMKTLDYRIKEITDMNEGVHRTKEIQLEMLRLQTIVEEFNFIDSHMKENNK
ncbi:MAG: toxic anion resistance protein [Lachnospiraceae bacterium]